MELETRRLYLRPWKEQDAPVLYSYAKDPDVGPVCGWPPHKSVKESRQIIVQGLSGDECYAVCEKETGKPIGCIELKGTGSEERELGYWLGKPFWGQGIMSEAARELLRHGFEDMGLSVIWCGYYEGNARSARVQEKLGFEYAATRGKALVPLLGEVRTEIYNKMTASQWKNRK